MSFLTIFSKIRSFSRQFPGSRFLPSKKPLASFSEYEGYTLLQTFSKMLVFIYFIEKLSIEIKVIRIVGPVTPVT